MPEKIPTFTASELRQMFHEADNNSEINDLKRDILRLRRDKLQSEIDNKRTRLKAVTSAYKHDKSGDRALIAATIMLFIGTLATVLMPWLVWLFFQ